MKERSNEKKNNALGFPCLAKMSEMFISLDVSEGISL